MTPDSGRRRRSASAVLRAPLTRAGLARRRTAQTPVMNRARLRQVPLRSQEPGRPRARPEGTAGQTGGERAGTGRRTIKAPDVPDSAPAIPGPRAGPAAEYPHRFARLDGARRVSEPAGTRTEPRWSPRQPGGHPARPQVSFTHIWYSGIFRCAGCNRLRCGSEVRGDVAASAPRLSAGTEHL